MNRLYEVMIVLRPTGAEAELAQVVKRLEEPIQKLGGQIESSEGWGRRRLAYPIARQVEGYYHLVRFRVAPEQLEELKRLFRLNDTVIRFLVLNRADGAPSMSESASRPPARAKAEAAVESSSRTA